MPRMARIVVPNYPHHVTQRGSRRQPTFFGENDYLLYLSLLVKNRRKTNVDVWAYCLMPNHVHLITVPRRTSDLATFLRLTHHEYARHINARNGWQGHLWQERFHSFVMDEPHLLSAVRYVELNPVRAGLCNRPEEWRWSSVHAHLHDRADPAVDTAPMRSRIADWEAYLATEGDGPSVEELRKLTGSGWPGGDDTFVSYLQKVTGRRLKKRKPGPKPKRRN